MSSYKKFNLKYLSINWFWLNLDYFQFEEI